MGKNKCHQRKKKKQSEKDKKAELDPHNQLYSGGFASTKDQEIMKKFHEAKNWEERYKIASSLEDRRFKFFGFRLIYQNQPHEILCLP